MTVLSLEQALVRLADRTDRLRRRADGRAAAWRRLAGAADLLVRGLGHVWRNRRYLTAVKLVNMALVNLQCRLRTERVIGMPYRMKIEPTNICNTRCQLCPTGRGLRGRRRGIMDWHRYTRLVDQLRRYLYTLDLSMWGDPLIVPDIYRMIRYAHRRGIWTYLSSNLHAFQPRRDAHRLVLSGLDMMTCSLHGASQRTYEIYQPGKQLQPILEKIRAIQQAKARLGRTNPVIQLNFVVTRFNQHEIDDFTRLAESLGCRPVFSNASLNLRLLDRDKHMVPLKVNGQQLRRQYRQMIERWLPDDDRYVIEPYRLLRDGQLDDVSHFNGRKLLDCHWPWKDCVVNWDGSVVPCCGVFDRRYDLGNVFDQPLHRIWNNRAYRLARRSFKRPVSPPDDRNNPCSHCPGFML